MLNEKYLEKTKTYVVGVSGGCDSMALLDLLYQAHYSIIVAHVNYNLRNDTQEDYRVVHNYCERHHIPFRYLEVEHHETKGNFQAQARDIRYSFYKEIIESTQCEGVILGHHYDDVIETIYMYLDRGNRAHYIGLRECGKVMGVQVIRPLLAVKKQALRDYCHINQIEYHDDYTNFETDFERDRVRNTILNHYTDEQKEALRLKAKEINERQARQEEAISPYLEIYKKTHSINYKKIPYLETFIYELLSLYLPTEMIKGTLIQEIIHQIKSHQPNIQLQLPIHFMFIKEYDNIAIVSNESHDSYCYCIEQGEETETPYFKIKKEGPLNNGVYLKDEDFPITIRTIRPGDRIVTSGGTKKVNRLFINAKVPARKRTLWPIVLNSQQEIILIPEIAKRKGYLTTKANFFVIK